LIEALAGLRRERERQGLSLTDLAEPTGMDRATIDKLDTRKIANPTIAPSAPMPRLSDGGWH